MSLSNLEQKVPKFKSLTRKLLTAIVVWVMLFFGFISLTGVITWRLEERAMVIYQVGVLNNQISRLAVSSTQDWSGDYADMQLILDYLNKYQQGACCQPDSRLNEVITQTQSFLNLLKVHYLDNATLLGEVDGLRKVLTSYARYLEQENTRHIGLLRLMRAILILMVVCSAVACFVVLKRTVLKPLEVLYQGINDITHGNLQTRLICYSNDEFKAVTNGFNQMAVHLQDMYVNLEQKVAAKTEALSRQNYEWEMLYHTTSFLHTQKDFDDEVEQEFLNRLMMLTACQSGVIFWKGYQSWYVGQVVGAIEWCVECEGYIRSIVDDRLSSIHYFYIERQDVRLVSIPVMSAQVLRGVVVLSLHQDMLTAADERLLRLLCVQLATAKDNADLIEIKQKNAVLEERNLIAQSLHDSLAQSLSFLNIHVQLLQKNNVVKQNLVVAKQLSVIQEGVHHCYQDVRELLNNFRARTEEGDLLDAVCSIVLRYQQQMALTVNLKLLIDEVSVHSQQQVQILFILQEALSNIRKHAQASRVDVVLDECDGVFKLEVIDDGIGFEYPGVNHGDHVGLLVMQERAAKIHAQINIVSVLGRGTRVSLLLPLI